MEDGSEGWTVEGGPPRKVGGADGGMADMALKVGGMVNVTREMYEREIENKPTRFYEMYRRGNYEAQARIGDMELDGVDASVVYPGRGMGLWSIKDPELRVACMEAYNDWLAEEFCAGAPDRVFGLACVPTDDGIERAVAELYRAVKKGHKGAFIASYPEVPFHDRQYDPLWAAAQDLGVPLHWHRANGQDQNLPRGMGIAGPVWGD